MADSGVGIAREDCWNDNIGADVDACERFGCDAIRMGPAGEHFAHEATLREIAGHLGQGGERAADHDLTFHDHNHNHNHNHDHEFLDLGDRTGYDALVAETSSVTFELDVGWASDTRTTPRRGLSVPFGSTDAATHAALGGYHVGGWDRPASSPSSSK